MPSEFPVVHTTIDVSSEEFAKHKEEWTDVIRTHEKAIQRCVSEGQEKYVKRHVERGMLLSTSTCPFPLII